MANSEYLNSFHNVFSSNHRTENHHGIVICGHRGGFSSTNTPENTIQAFSKAIEIGILPKNTKVVINCLLSGENKKTETQLVLSDSTGSFYQVHYLMGDVYNAERELQYSFEINQKITTPLRCYFWNPNETYPVLLKQFEIFVYQKK